MPPEPSAPVVRARRLGRLAAVERAELLCDEGSFARLGAGLIGSAGAGDGLVGGTGLVDGRPVTVLATDGAVERGTLGEAGAKLATRLIEGARRLGQPVVLLLDSDGARSREGVPAVLANAGWLAALADLGGHVPRLGAVFGAAGGSAAYALALCDLAVGVAERSFAFVAGPAVVARALGEQTALTALGTGLHARTGLLHAAVEDDRAALAWLREALSYLPGAAWEAPPRAGAQTRGEPPEGGLEGAVPDDVRAPWRVEDAVARLVDATARGPAWLELGAAWGAAIRTGLARVGGRPALLVCSSPADQGGALDAAASRKLSRFLRFSAAFGLPIATLCDTPGFLPGRASEEAAILCHGSAVIAAYAEASRWVPRVAVVVRRAIGAGSVLAAEAELVLALPGAVVAQMHDPLATDGADGTDGVAAFDAEATGFAHRTVAPEAVRAELVHALVRLGGARPVEVGGRRMALFAL